MSSNIKVQSILKYSLLSNLGIDIIKRITAYIFFKKNELLSHSSGMKTQQKMTTNWLEILNFPLLHIVKQLL